MATPADVDTKQAVGKFLQRQIITPRADNTANTANEITAVLETIATAFLLYPQAALTLVMGAKNSLQQIVQADISVVEFMLAALSDVENRDVPITDSSDLIEAQTALVELDKIGRLDSSLQAFSRYQSAIQRFLDKQLGPTLKRNGTGTLERTGDEARQDIFSILPHFTATHKVMAFLLKALQRSVDDFRSVKLTNVVSSLTISRVRSSITRVKTRIEQGAISKTTAAIELLAGSSSLTSISSTGDLFDPTIQTSTPLPKNTSITFQPEDVEATILSSSGPWTLGAAPWNFVGTMDPLGPNPQPFNFVIPGTGASNRAYVSSDGLTATFSIAASSKLYIHLESVSPSEIEVALTSGGAVPIATLVSDIDTALGASGDCIQNPSTFGFLIFGSAAVTSIIIRSTASGASGSFTTDPSAHTLLGFVDGQTSLPVGQFNSVTLAAAIRNQLPSGIVAVEGDNVRITSELTDSDLSSIFFDAAASNAVQDSFGFVGTTESQPSYVELIDGDVLTPDDEGVYIGSVVTTAEDPSIIGSEARTLNNEPIIDIQGTRIFFSPSISIPRRTSSITVSSPIVSAVQTMTQSLISFVGEFDDDIDAVQHVLSPIVSKATRAQVGDARRVLEDVNTRLNDLLVATQAIIVRPDRSQFNAVAMQVLSALEERGLDRAQELLSSGQFSVFFSLGSDNASKSNRLLTAMENVARQDLPVSTLEVDIDDDQTPRGTNPDSTILANTELEGSGTLTTDI